MIRLIRAHNVLNGLWFSVLEFLVMAVVVVGFAIYFAIAGMIVFTVALLGVGANCLAVVAVGVGSLRAGEEDRGLRATFSPSSRARILEEHPEAERAMWVLTVVTLIPFAVALGCLSERGRRPS